MSDKTDVPKPEEPKNDKTVVVQPIEWEQRKPEFVRICLHQVVNDMVDNISFTEFQQVVPSIKSVSVAMKIYEIYKEDIVKEVTESINSMYEEMNLDEKFAELNTALAKPAKKEVENQANTCEFQLAAARKQILFEKKQKLEEMIRRQQGVLLKTRLALLTKEAKLKDVTEQGKETVTMLRNS